MTALFLLALLLLVLIPGETVAKKDRAFAPRRGDM